MAGSHGGSYGADWLAVLHGEEPEVEGEEELSPGSPVQAVGGGSPGRTVD